MQSGKLTPSQERRSYFCAFVFIVTMVAAASFWDDREIVLPEIAAMAVALFAYREQSWMRHPEKIFLWPTVTALLGFGINLLAIPFAFKLVLVLVAMLLFFFVFRYSLAPALATGFLPVVTNATELSFIAAILISTFLLMLVVMLGRFRHDADRATTVQASTLLAYGAIVLACLGGAAAVGQIQLAVLPPVAVVVYESLQMKMYSWRMVIKQTTVLTLSAAIGVALFLLISNWVLVVLVDMVLMWGLLRVFQMRMPAVYAFPLLAYVFPSQSLSLLPVAALLVSGLSLSAVLFFHRRRMPAQSLA